MPVPVPTSVRQRIHARWQRGLVPTAIARDLRLGPPTVRHLCQQFRRQGASALVPAYAGDAPPTPSAAVQQALLLHEEHPDCGAPYLLIQLRQLQPDLPDLPSARALQRWLRRLDQPAAPQGASRRPRRPGRNGPTRSGR